MTPVPAGTPPTRGAKQGKRPRPAPRHALLAFLAAAAVAVIAAAVFPGDPPAAPAIVAVDMPPRPARADSAAAPTPPAASAPAPAATGPVAAGDGWALSVPAIVDTAVGGAPAAPASGLIAAPVADLVERRHGRALPRIAADGRRPWQVYARPFDLRSDRPRVAIIVTGLGLSATATAAAIASLPADVSFAFDPHGAEVAAWAARARAAGHEVLLVLPMESARFPFEDAGALALTASSRPEHNRQRLDYLLGTFPGYVGVLGLGGSRLAAEGELIAPVLGEIDSRGLLYVEGTPDVSPMSLAAAARLGLPRAAVDVWIDERATAAAIDGRLAELEALARTRSAAVGLARPLPLTMQRIAHWADRVDPDRVALAPVSAVAGRPIPR